MRQFGAFTTAQALTWHSTIDVKAKLRTGCWRRLHDGVYCDRSAEPSALLQWSAACLAIGRIAPACLHTAAALHGFGVVDDGKAHVAVDPATPCRHRPGLWPHQLVLAPTDVVRLGTGALTTKADRTAADLARILPPIDALAVLDAALASGACSAESLVTELTRHVGLRGVRKARELVPLASPLPESPQESRLRMRCLDAGLPPPRAPGAGPRQERARPALDRHRVGGGEGRAGARRRGGARRESAPLRPQAAQLPAGRRLGDVLRHRPRRVHRPEAAHGTGRSSCHPSIKGTCQG